MTHMTHSTARRWGRLSAMAVGALLVLSACVAKNSASPGASGAATGAQFCQGMKIVFFPGGTAGGGSETVVYNGAKAAAAALGPNVTYQWSDWDLRHG